METPEYVTHIMRPPSVSEELNAERQWRPGVLALSLPYSKKSVKS